MIKHITGPPEASQLAMQQMMFMKMMSTNQSTQLPPLSISADKRASSSNGDKEEEEADNSANDEPDDEQPKEVLCEPEIDFSENYPKTEANFEANYDSRGEPGDDEDNKSLHSEKSNQETDWSSRDWKMSLKFCENADISPDELQKHIKAQLQAAMSATGSENTKAEEKTVNTDKFGMPAPVHTNGTLVTDK